MDKYEAVTRYGFAVLQVLEADKDWGPDTLDELARIAARAGLATTGDAGLFTATKKTTDLESSFGKAERT